MSLSSDFDFDDAEGMRDSDANGESSANDATGSDSSNDSGSELAREIAELLAKPGGKIQAIKRYREATGVGLKEAKDAIESLQQKHGLSQQSGCAGVLLCAVMIAAVVAVAIT